MTSHKHLTAMLPAIFILALYLFALLITVGVSRAQESDTEPNTPSTETTLLTVSILVLGGEAKTPVPHAHVYLRLVTDESQLSEAITNSNGLAVLEGIPHEKMRLQVTAANWVTRALVVDLADPELASPIEVVLEPSQEE